MKICLNKELYTNVHNSLNMAAKSQKYSVSINRQIDKLWVYSYNGTVGSNNEEQTTNTTLIHFKNVTLRRGFSHFENHCVTPILTNCSISYSYLFS